MTLEMGEEISPVTAEKSPEVKVTLDSKTIRKAISALKKVNQWPEEGVESTPRYSDESATIYLQCTPRQKLWKPAGTSGKDVILPNPLSYNRSVCLVVPDSYAKQDEQGARWTELLKEIGITGEIKVVPRSYLQVPIQQEAEYFLEELASTYDVHLADMKSVRLLFKNLVPVLYKQGKTLYRVDLRKDQKEHLQTALSKSPLTINSFEKTYAWKVAHAGQTDVQIRENVEAALKTIDALDKSFPGGLAHFRSVQLKTDCEDGVVIYVNTAEDTPTPEDSAEVVASGKKKKLKRTHDVANEGTLITEEEQKDEEAGWMPIVEIEEESVTNEAGESKKKKKKKSKGDTPLETPQETDSAHNVGESQKKKKKKKKTAE